MTQPKRLWKVGDLIRHTKLSRQTIHNYVQLGLIQEEEQTPAGHRLFDSKVFRRLDRIAKLKAQGLKLQEIADRLLKSARKRRTTHKPTTKNTGARVDEPNPQEPTDSL